MRTSIPAQESAEGGSRESQYPARIRARTWLSRPLDRKIGGVDAELITQVSASTGLSAGEAARVVADVIGWYREPVELYVRRRHAHLHMHGKKNDEIFTLIAVELGDRLVAAPDLSVRQLRRIVYG